MGNQICCTGKQTAKSIIRITAVKKKNQDSIKTSPFIDAFSTSDDSSQATILNQQTPKTQKMVTFQNYIKNKDIQLSSIPNKSEYWEDSGQQKLFICYLQKLQKQMQQKYGQKNSNISDCFLKREQKMKMDQKRFIEHSNKCPICFELLQNLNNMQNIEGIKCLQEEDQNRISLRDSLLEFQQCDKKKRSVECKCPILISSQEAKKALRKFPNTNKYQSKKLKFRKTSLFQPEINQVYETDSSQQM